MKQIQFNDLTLPCPETYSEMPLCVYANLVTLFQNGLTNTMADMTNIVSAVTEMPVSIIKNLPINDMIDIYSTTIELLKTEPEHIDTSVLNLYGVEYKAQKPEEMTTRQFTDFDTLAEANVGKNFTTLLAIMYVPDTGDDYFDNVKQFAENVKYIDTDFALSAINSFSMSLLRFVSTILGSSEQAKKMMEESPKMKEQMEIISNFLDGAGI